MRRRLPLSKNCHFSAAQILALNQKIVELKGIKKPDLKRVKKTTDDMLGACTDNSRLMKADFKANLKTVKKEEEKVKVTADETSAAKHERVRSMPVCPCVFCRGKR